MLGQIAYSESDVFDNFYELFDIRGKNVLEIGGSISLEKVQRSEVKKWVSVDPLNSEEYLAPNYRKIKGLGCSIPIEDEYFDFIFSCNAFEHIIDLDKTLKEAKRLMKYGAVLYSHFGPIWSAPDGHHLDINLNGKELNFWEVSILPHWSHLIFEADQMTSMLSKNFVDSEVDKIVFAVYNSNWLNRMDYEDYIYTFMNSGLKLSHLTTSHLVDYSYTFPDYGIDEGWFLDKSQEFIKNDKNVHCRDILAILFK